MASVEEVKQEDARAWELLEQQRADAAVAAKAAEELAENARAQAMTAFDDCTAAVDAQQGAKVAADMQAREISKQKFHEAQQEKSDRALAQRMANELRR